MKLLRIIIAACLFGFAVVCVAVEKQVECEDDCANCETSGKDAGHADEDEHEGHAHGSEAPKRIEVTAKQVKQRGIKTVRAVKGSVRKKIRVPGEVKVNSDRVAHVVSRAAGIVRNVRGKLGDAVRQGDILALVESEEFAAAKLDFYAKETEVGCCEITLPRAKEIYENVAKLIDLLDKGASEDDIKKLDGTEMGSYRGQLLVAHAAYISAKTTYEQELALRAKKISSVREMLNAETVMKQARANFQGIMDTARYETLVQYSEALQERQLAGFNAVAAEKKLRLKGADDKIIRELRALVPKIDTLKPCKCSDPECKSGKLPLLGDVLGNDAEFALYVMTAPIGGRLIAKHIVMGESIDSSTEVFTIADLSSVWVDLAVSQEDISAAREGYPVAIIFPDGGTANAKISFVSSVVDSKTRTILARAVLDNGKGRFRPGTFIEAVIRVPSNAEVIVVPKRAVQLINDYPCVFVWDKGGFEVREVELGISNENQVEILSGLNEGEILAGVNAFHLKAEFIKSAAGDLGDHHGHDH